MLDHRTNQFLLLAGLGGLLAACGGGGGDGGGPSPATVFAGEDVSTLSRSRVSLVASVVEGDGVASFLWTQVTGAPVQLEDVPGGPEGAISFLAPDIGGDGLSAGGATLGSDSVMVAVDAPRVELAPAVLSTIDLGGSGRALRSAYHPATSRVFVIDPVLEEVAVFDLTDPTKPIPVGSISAPPAALGYVPGPPLDVD
ncbi:hypothetical protein N9L90_04630, partial [Planctomycetota bacterium]|nr:hypothetical protein [Planctomycetota bacterium]